MALQEFAGRSPIFLRADIQKNAGVAPDAKAKEELLTAVVFVGVVV
jgi:hypothetical protein